ncbi:MAG TPA: glycosyltransferase, partial [Candidatus Bathyarchaeia archaeon]|nr:glycosyltransferase [Candidatus Bathyarchaeia archaeon]
MKTLKERNFKVTLATLDRTSWTHISRVFGSSSRPYGEFYLMNKIPEIPVLALRQAFIVLLYLLELLLINLRRKNRLVINMAGEVVDSLGDVVYVNAIPLKLMHVFPAIQPKQGAQWKCYSRLYSIVTRILKTPGNIIVTNSRFNQAIIKKELGEDALVVSPPVDLTLIKSMENNAARDNIVLTISRFRSAKNLKIIPEIARRVENCKFIIVGTADKGSEECLLELSERIRDLAVEERVQLFVNRPFSFVLEMLAIAKVYLHTQACEAFGMSIVEAMAAGCVPVVPGYGGPWFDILDRRQGEYGYSFNSLEEAAEVIKTLIGNETIRAE